MYIKESSVLFKIPALYGLLAYVYLRFFPFSWGNFFRPIIPLCRSSLIGNTLFPLKQFLPLIQAFHKNFVSFGKSFCLFRGWEESPCLYFSLAAARLSIGVALILYLALIDLAKSAALVLSPWFTRTLFGFGFRFLM